MSDPADKSCCGARPYAGSIRLIFSQCAEIMHYIGDESSATGLSYERIGAALSKTKPQKRAAKMLG